MDTLAAVIFFVVHSEPVQEVEFKVSTCKKHQGLTPFLKSEVNPRKREGSAVIINPLPLIIIIIIIITRGLRIYKAMVFV